MEAIVMYQCGSSPEELKKTTIVSFKTASLWAQIQTPDPTEYNAREFNNQQVNSTANLWAYAPVHEDDGS